MSALQYESFDFLAQAKDWEEKCVSDPKNVDTLPPEFLGYEQKRWTFPAQLLATLKCFSKEKIYSKQTLASIAENGSMGIRGYPGLVSSLPVGTETDGKGKPTKFAQWKNYVYPTPKDIEYLPKGSVLLCIDISLRSPFYSRDDMCFYPTENVLRRDFIFDVPMLSASAMKGLLHWAYHMSHNSVEEDEYSRFLFGTIASNTADDSIQGVLRCYPVLWSGTVGLSVINPMDRNKGTGSVPIKYEVLQKNGKAKLYFVIPNLPERKQSVLTAKHMEAFFSALSYLLEYGGLSAKSSSGYGACTVNASNAAISHVYSRCTQKSAATTTSVNAILDKNAKDSWSAFVGSDGNLLPLAGNDAVFTNKRIKAVLGCSNSELKNKEQCYKRLEELFAKQKQSQSAASEQTSENKLDWMWDSAGEQDFTAFCEHVCKCLKEEEAKA